MNRRRGDRKEADKSTPLRFRIPPSLNPKRLVENKSNGLKFEAVKPIDSKPITRHWEIMEAFASQKLTAEDLYNYKLVYFRGAAAMLSEIAAICDSKTPEEEEVRILRVQGDCLSVIDEYEKNTDIEAYYESEREYIAERDRLSENSDSNDNPQ